MGLIMNMRRIRYSLAALGLTALVCGGVLVADAHAWQARQVRQQYESLNPEMQTKYDAILQAFHEKMTPLTEKMMARRLELDALAGNANADPKRIATLAEEIAALKTQIRQERFNLDERLRKEVGIEMRSGRGDGYHHGRGREQGRDCMAGQAYRQDCAQWSRSNGNCGNGGPCSQMGAMPRCPRNS